MALKLLVAIFLHSILHFGINDAASTMTSMNLATAVDVLHQRRHTVPAPRLGDLISSGAKSSLNGNSSVHFGKSQNKLAQQSSLRTRNIVQRNAVPRGDGYGQDNEEKRPTGDQAYKQWLYSKTMAMFRQRHQNKYGHMLVHRIFSEKLADMVALAESLVQYLDGNGSVNDYLDEEIKKDVDFMKAIRNAKIKFAKEKEEAQKRINDNFMATNDGLQRKSPSKQTHEQLTQKEVYNTWLYHNTMAMFSHEQESKIREILIGKLFSAEDIGQQQKDPNGKEVNFAKIAAKIFEVTLAECLVEYLNGIGKIEEYLDGNYTIFVIITFMARNNLKSLEQQQKFMESYLHLYADNCHMGINDRLEAAFEHYENQQ